MSKKVFPIQPVAAARLPAPAYDGAPLADTLGRHLRDLRISVTDRCNFRCVYCMPREVYDASYRFLPHAEILSFEEILRLAKLFAGLGVQKIRLTGGEPLMRKDLPRLVELLATHLPDVDLTLTTNGALLGRHARALAQAGLKRITVSLDSLDDASFRKLVDADYPLTSVLEGIEAAAAAGLAPIKINMVVKRGVNDHEVAAMARHWRARGLEAGRPGLYIPRFIEYMDVGSTNGWRMDEVLPSREVAARIGAEFDIEPAEANYPGEVAARWRYRDGSGEFGVISSVTQAFCRDCNRLRLSTEGSLYTCLFAGQGHDLKTLLRSGAEDGTLVNEIAALWRAREDRYSELRGAATAGHEAPLRKVEMSYIGG
jgi:cyclic pyranopterin phosphate synthase